VISVRFPAERGIRWWTAAELAAVAYEIRAGRFKVIPKGMRGLPEMPFRWGAADCFRWLPRIAA
jgi:hypothetical protein